MELLLNAIWLAVATSLLRECTAGRRKWQSLIGLVCVLALLFPAISLTDDLHPTEFALADTKSLYAVAHSQDLLSPAPRNHSPIHGLAGILRVSQFRPVMLLDDSDAVVTQIFSLPESDRGRLSGRAPPFLS
jgi:hypothetical protein